MPRRFSSGDVFAGILIVFGTITRVAQYASCRSYWSDEALLFLNIRDQSIRGLLGHLNFGQAAPPGFLLAERAMLHLFGGGEYSMRLLPLLAGLLALFIFARLVRRLFAPTLACVPIAMFVLCDAIIWHTASLKQYSLDILTAVIVLDLMLARPQQPVWRRLTACALFSAIAIWFSYTTIFMFGAIAIVLVPRLSWDGRDRVVIALVLFLGSFLTLYVSVMRHQADPYLTQFWGEHSHAFANFKHPIGIPAWLLRQTFFIFDTSFRRFGVIILMFVATGIYSLWISRRREYVGICLAPFGLVAVAGLLHRYPYAGGRITVFLQPGIFILFGFGLVYLLAHPHRRVHWIGCAALAPLVWGASLSIKHLAVPRTRSMIGPAALYVRAHRRPGEGLYLVGEGRNPNKPAISSGRARELLCYYPNPPAPVHTAMTSVADISEKWFWVAFAFQPGPAHRNLQYLRPLLDEIRRIADEKDRFVEPKGGAAILFERRRVDDEKPGPLRPASRSKEGQTDSSSSDPLVVLQASPTIRGSAYALTSKPPPSCSAASCALDSAASSEALVCDGDFTELAFVGRYTGGPLLTADTDVIGLLSFAVSSRTLAPILHRLHRTRVTRIGAHFLANDETVIRDSSRNRQSVAIATFVQFTCAGGFRSSAGRTRARAGEMKPCAARRKIDFPFFVTQSTSRLWIVQLRDLLKDIVRVHEPDLLAQRVAFREAERQREYGLHRTRVSPYGSARRSFRFIACCIASCARTATNRPL